ncbi:serine hydrolase domain-containing protein [Celeribacter sp.]|uniref:serine hydrolase domain-containing protein n=1 Tax=Celeribacter sp. TaxID=1890673 RepID=UPI003A8EB754
MSGTPSRLERLADRMSRSAWHNGVALSLYDRETGRETHVGGGALDKRTPYFATGVTKLFVTAILLQLCEEEKIDLDAPFLRYIGDRTPFLDLHVKEGVDRTDQVTIKHLMSHTSGFGDHFLLKYQARALKHQVAEGVDSSWGFEDVLLRARSHGAVFAPGEGTRASYTDTNFHILGRVIEEVEGMSFARAVQTRIADRLGLRATYVYCDPSDHRPVDPMSRSREIHVPRSLASFQADGGIVTTSRESMVFARGFFEGYLFDKRVLPRLYSWRPIVFSAEYGAGLMHMQVPWWMTVPYRLRYCLLDLFRAPPRLIGHIGRGSVCFYAPDEGVYVAGTVNQLNDPARGLVFAMRGVEEVAGRIRSQQMRDARLHPMQNTPAAPRH